MFILLQYFVCCHKYMFGGSLPFWIPFIQLQDQTVVDDDVLVKQLLPSCLLYKFTLVGDVMLKNQQCIYTENFVDFLICRVFTAIGNCSFGLLVGMPLRFINHALPWPLLRPVLLLCAWGFPFVSVYCPQRLISLCVILTPSLYHPSMTRQPKVTIPYSSSTMQLCFALRVVIFIDNYQSFSLP